MIAAFMLYSIAIGGLLALAALLADRAAAALGAARRSIWTVAIVSTLVVPAMMLGLGSRDESTRAIASDRERAAVRATTSTQSSAFTTASTFLEQTSSPLRRVERLRLDFVLSMAWGISSASLVMLYVFAWTRTRRQLRNWPRAVIAGRSVRLSQDVGPAVFGLAKPVIIVPEWLRSAPSGQQALVLEHEHQHIAARDPLVLILALGCTLIVPWNIAMWWQLKRLRFAIEVDCDARVVKRGADALTYSETLLQVGRQFLRAPLSAVALIEPPSDLERRIRILTSVRQRRAITVATACAALCASLVVGAAQIEPPAIDRSELRLPPPRADVGTQIEGIVRERYPELFEPSQTQPGLVNIVLNSDLTVDWSEKKLLPIGTTQAAVEAREQPERSLDRHLQPAEPRSMGRLLLSSGADTPGVFVAFAVKRTTSDATPHDGAATRATQRALVERHFPDIADGSSNPHQLLWILLDTTGEVIDSGREATSPDPLLINLERRYPGAATSQRITKPLTRLFARPMHDDQGQPLLVTFAWLRKEDQQRARVAPAAAPIGLDMTVYRNGVVTENTPLTLDVGATQSHASSLLRLDISALDAGKEMVDIGVAIRVPVGNEGVEFAPRWELVSQPMIRTRLGQEAVIEQGVRYPGKEGDVMWKIVLKPRSAT